ncbi:hypothetical protein BH24ACI5_BH24ACI5_02440 [soil metagenome]
MPESARLEELRRRVQSDPASIAFAALAEAYRRAGRFDEAIAACAAGLTRHPSYLSAHVTLGRALIEACRYDEAREELELVLRAAPENLAAIRGLADLHARRGDTIGPAGESAGGATPAASPMRGGSAVSIAHPTPPAPSHPRTDARLMALEHFLDAVHTARDARAGAPR